jgi:hypothetical protein
MSNNYPIRINSDLKAHLREAALRDGFRHLSKWLLWLAENRAQQVENTAAEKCHCGFKLGHPGMCQGTF